MPKYLVAIYRPNDVRPAEVVTEEVGRDIQLLNDEIVAAGVRAFVGGLQATGESQWLVQHEGGVVSAEEPFLKASAYMDGFWVIEAAGMDEAVAWGRKAAAACRAAVEVRPFY